MSSDPPALKICVFGAMSVEVDGISVGAKLARKELWLLAILALRTGRAVPRDTLGGMLWPEREEEQALYNLRRSLTRLKSALGSQGDSIQQVKPRSLVFAGPPDCVDALNFDRLAASGEPCLLREAVRLCAGPLLQNCYEEWAQSERLPREFAYQKALETLATDALTRGDWLEAEKVCRLHIAANPLQEQAHRLLMQALAKSGNHAAATQAYRDLRVRLREEINAEPDPETLACYEAIRQTARQAVPVPAKTAPLPPAPVPAPRSIALPQPLTRLIGRDLEVLEACGHLSASRLVTLLGAGGVGKTRLSIEVARQTAERMADGAIFVELAALSKDALPVTALARALGVAEKSGEPLLDTLTQALREQEKLLVLDNCEHLRQSCAELAHALLTACPRLRILTTSRQALGLPGEIVWRVPSLPTPPDISADEFHSALKQDDTLDYASAQLFLERVMQTYPEFRLSPTLLPCIGQICRRLDGIPLAIELAAYRARSLSLEKIATRLSDRFHLLTGGGTASLPRQQTLRALIDWSYSLLEPDEQQLFARLSVFAGGWTLEAAEAIAREQETGNREEKSSSQLSTLNSQLKTPLPLSALDLLTSLVDKSLVGYEWREEGGRYFFLESIREYARERLEEAGEWEQTRQRHADYFSELAVETEPRLLGPQQGELLEMLEREHDNMRAVLAWGQENAAGAAPAFRLASRLWRFWMQRGYFREGREHLQRVLENPHNPDDADCRCRALNGAGMLAYRMGDLAPARALLEASIAVARTAGDNRGAAAAFANLGHIPAGQGQYQEAREMYAEALQLYRKEQNESGTAYSLLNLGNVALSLCEFSDVQASYEEALALFRRIGDGGGELLTLGNLGWYSLMQEDWPRATTYSEQALTLCRQLKRPEGEALYLPVLGASCEKAGDMARARQCYLQALEVSLKLGDKRTLVSTLETLAAYYLRREEYAQSARYYGCADVGYDQIAMSRMAREQQNREEAFAILRERMGDEPFAACFARGQQLSMEDLAREAVSEQS